jgi:hypothetical protein
METQTKRDKSLKEVDFYTLIAPFYDILAGSFLRPARKGIVQAAEALVLEGLHVGLGSESLLAALLQNLSPESGYEAIQDPVSLPLSEGDRGLLAGIVMHEEEGLTEELLEGALEALRHRGQLAQREGEIKRGIAEAERRGDMVTLLRLKQEKLELDRKLSGAG